MLLNSVDEVLTLVRPELPFIIPTFNCKTYLEMMVNQIREQNIIIIDSCSTSEDMIEYLHELSKDYVVIRKPENSGPNDYYDNIFLWRWLPDQFVISDPDIGFNIHMPNNYLDIMEELSFEIKAFKVGLALDIWLEDKTLLDMVGPTGMSIFEFEKRYWDHPVGNSLGLAVYAAPTDTTFCYVNKDYFQGEPHAYGNGVRIAGNFTAQHYGWWTNPPISLQEQKTYYETTKSYSTVNDVKKSNN